MLPLRVHTIVVSVQHDEVVRLDEMRDCLKEQVVRAVVPSAYLDEDTIYHLQPSGRFVIGGPQVRPDALQKICSTSVIPANTPDLQRESPYFLPFPPLCS